MHGNNWIGRLTFAALMLGVSGGVTHPASPGWHDRGFSQPEIRDTVLAAETGAPNLPPSVPGATKGQREEALRREARRAFGNPDVVGIRLGMTLSEAEQIIRDRMKVGWVAEPNPTEMHMVRQRAPYTEFRAFASEDGREQIVLFSHPDLTDRVLAVSRVIRLEQEISHENITESLLKKYGKNPVFRNSAPEEIHWGANSPLNENRYEEIACKAEINDIGPGQLRGIPLKLSHRSTLTPWIRIRSTTSGVNVWEVEKWRSCWPTVIADLSSTRLPSPSRRMSVSLFDLSAYADIYQKFQNSKQQPTKSPDL